MWRWADRNVFSGAGPPKSRRCGKRLSVLETEGLFPLFAFSKQSVFLHGIFTVEFYNIFTKPPKEGFYVPGFRKA
jgi:hypothetical protein